MFNPEQGLTKFEHGLAAIDFSADNAILEAFKLLHKGVDPDELVDRMELNSFGAIKSFYGQGLSGTHFKRWIYGEGVHPDLGANVWRHDYTGLPAHGKLIEEPHHHRADIAIAIIEGGYTFTSYHVEQTTPESATTKVIEELHLTAGALYWMHADAVHTVSEVQSDTLTVMIQGRPRYTSSRAFLPNGTVRISPASSEDPVEQSYLANLTNIATPHWPTLPESRLRRLKQRILSM